MKHLKYYKLFESSDNFSKAGAETQWELEDGTLVKLSDIVTYLDSIKSPVIEINTDDLKDILIDTDRDPNRIEAADLNFPIIVSKYKGKYYSILDGQHRLVKCIKNGIDKVKSRILELDNCPEKFKNVFIREILENKTFAIFESSNKKFINDFIFDFGMLITMGFSQITKMGIDQKSTDELNSMMNRLRSPLINGMNYAKIIDDLNYLYKNPKILSAFIGKIRELLIYIEPRIRNFVKDGDTKNKWLIKIEKFKERYKEIVS